MLQTHLDEAKVKHNQEIADKQKAHASAIAKKNATIQESESEKETQDYIRMHYELVDEVDGAHQCAEDTGCRSVKGTVDFKRQAAFSARVSTGRLHKWRHWKDQYMSRVEKFELEREHFAVADELRGSMIKLLIKLL
jgi:hypothetical protein